MRTTPYEEGSPDARICFIAQAPSFVEMRLGRPLVGPAGKIFDECLHQAGIIRASVYILNVFEDQVIIDKKTGNLYERGSSELLWVARQMRFTESAQPYLQRLRRRINACKANVICPLGQTAMDAVCYSRRIGRWRGSIIEADHYKGRKVVATFHPASVVHGQPLNKYIISKDMERVKAQSASSKIKLKHRELIIQPKQKELFDFLKMVSKEKRINYDVEILNRHVSCLSIAPNPQLSMSIPFVLDFGESYWPPDIEGDIWLYLAKILGNPKITKINQNILFDNWVMLYLYNIHVRGRLEDPMVAYGICYPDFLKRLEFTTSILTDIPYYKEDGKTWWKPIKDWPQFWLYNAKDSPASMEVWDSLQEDLDDGYRETYEFVMSLYPSFLYMMMRGMKVDSEALKASSEELKKQMVGKQAELDKIIGKPLNVWSAKQCQAWFYGQKGIKPYVSMKTHAPTTDDKALARIFRRYRLPEAKLVQEIRELDTLNSRYMEIAFDDDGRLRCSYDPTGATTGRQSSSQTVFGTGANMQNLDPRFRHFLVAG